MGDYQSAKEEVRRAADIVELIGQFVQLRKAGQNYVGLCPFHSEKDPSFTVSPSRQMFHCFGCKKGGDVFSFWMDYHKVDFPQALKDLADRYQVSLPEKPLTPFEREKMEVKEWLFKLNGVAAEYFHGILTRSEKGGPGRTYFDKRSIPKETILEFSLGYAPDEWDGLASFFQRKKMDLKKAAQAGLLIPRKNGGYYDRFRGRVIFPILNLRQQIVGFGGRVLDDSLPKYVNTPETPVFHKGELLYGLHVAYKSIRDSGRAVVVEGYTDVLALKRHGFDHAVATLGTALTRQHVRRLKGYAKEAVVVFDADSAGKAAAIKSLSSFMNEGLSSRVMVLPEGNDPDSYVNKNGLNSFLALLDASLPMFEYYLDLKLSQTGDEVEGQVSALK
ncbi:MAG: DNA primase, partial [Desulfobacteraceae bacterium]